MTPEETALAVFTLLGGTRPLSFVVDGKPHVKKRPRVTRYGTYAPDSAEEAATRRALKSHFLAPLSGPVVVVAVFWMPNRRVLDGDNLAKHLHDAGNGALYLDDSQVTASTQLVELDRVNPRTFVIVGPREGGTMTR